MTLFAQTVRPVGQAAIGRNVVALTVVLFVFIVLWSDASVGQLGGLGDIYTTRAVVTGKDERNRPLGFKLCFEDVLVKVSGDASILSDRHEPASDVAAVVVDSLKALDPNRPIREADSCTAANRCQSLAGVPTGLLFTQDAAEAPRNAFAFLCANSRNVVGFTLNNWWIERSTCDSSPPFSRSLTCSSRASAIAGGIP